jgi:uncharacterized protein YsxB (DUF464 family)
MINIRIYRDNQGRISGFNVKGHANFEEYGKDIVCAAVSALIHTAVFSLISLAGITPDFKVSDGSFKCTVNHSAAKKHDTVDVILESMLIGLKEIRKEYSKHVQITEILRDSNKEV